MKPGLLAAALIFTVISTGCDHSDKELPTTSMQIGSKKFQIEIASTSAQQEHGLMQRDSLPEDHGMIFAFKTEEPRGFWMKNTRIPLDIIFLNSGGKVVSIRQLEPYDRRVTKSVAPAQYAIELNKGAASAAGVKIGDQVDLPDTAKGK